MPIPEMHSYPKGLRSATKVCISAYLYFIQLVVLLSIMPWNSPRLVWGAGVAPDPLRDTNCPQECACGTRAVPQRNNKLLNSVQCTNSKLYTIPEPLPPGTEALLLRANKIASVDDTWASEIAAAETIRVIDLSHNVLNTISSTSNNNFTNINDTTTHSGVFSSMVYLEYLNLQSNQLKSLQNDSFVGLHNLEVLLLDDNQITFIDNSTFRFLNRLRMLTLNDNLLESINRPWFIDLTSLSILDLSDNNIQFLESSALDDLTQLNDLHLENNRLSSIRKQAFQGVTKLQTLALGGNNFSRVPTRALTAFSNLKVLKLSKNPISSLSFSDFQNVHIQDLYLDYLSELVTVDSHTFSNMLDLSALYLSNNQRLKYLDPQSFENVPNLQMLDLHNNKLIAFPFELLQSMPSLNHLDLQDNPLRCDCNIKWMHDAMHTNHSTPDTSIYSHTITIAAIEHLRCAAPSELAGQMVYDLIDDLPTKCAPVIVSSLNSTYQIPAGSSMRLVCRAVGAATSHLYWLLYNGKMLNQSSNYSRIKLLNSGTLVIDHIKPSDAGRYTCVASNNAGKTSYATMVRVHNQDLSLIPLSVNSKSISVTWNSSVASSKYVILYRRQVNTKGNYGSVRIYPFMRSYTIQPLEAGKKYDFCIGYEFQGKNNIVNCQTLETLSRRYSSSVKRAVSIRMLVILVTCLVGAAAGLCVLASVINVCRQRGYKDPEYETRIARSIRDIAAGGMVPSNDPTTTTTIKPGDTLANYSSTKRSTSEPRLDEMSQIPLDNLYPPSSTPLCTSTTSLISTNNHKL